MTTLHTINKAPSDTTLWQSCLSAILPGDALLMMENAVYASRHPDIIQQLARLQNVSLYFLVADIQARGLSQPAHSEAALIDDDQFVVLSCQHAKVVSWF